MKHFFDVGANIGQTFDDYLCRTNQYDGWMVWCFEPSPRHLPELINRAIKEGSRYKIKICPFGLWNKTIILRLWEKYNDPRGDSFIEKHSVNLTANYEIIATAISVCELINEYIGVDDEITIKIDAEGAEYPILSNILEDHFLSIRKRIKRILVEWHAFPLENSYGTQQELESRLRQAGLAVEQWMF